MSALVTGLSIGGAIGGGIAGGGISLLGELAAVFMFGLLGGRTSSSDDSSLLKGVVIGAAVGAAVLGGSGWVYENGISPLFDKTANPAPTPVTAPADPASSCVKNAPQGYTIAISKDGTCTYAPK